MYPAYIIQMAYFGFFFIFRFIVVLVKLSLTRQIILPFSFDFYGHRYTYTRNGMLQYNAYSEYIKFFIQIIWYFSVLFIRDKKWTSFFVQIVMVYNVHTFLLSFDTLLWWLQVVSHACCLFFDVFFVLLCILA